VSASTPDPAGTVVLALREWGAWLVATPIAFKALTRYEGLACGRLVPYLRLGAVLVLGSLVVPIIIDQVTDTRSAASSIVIFLPRYVAALVVVYLVWHVFLRTNVAADNGERAQPAEAHDRHYPETLLVSKGSDECLIQVERVQHLSAAGNYVEIHAGDRPYLMRATMKQAEELLSPCQFVRIHRSHIVNVNQIERIKTQRSGSGTVHLRCGAALRMSKKYRAELQKFRPQA